MKIPPKPKRGKRSPFYWWRRWKSHKYLPVRAGLLARIRNGDFEYPEQFEWAEYEMHYMKDEHDEYRAEYQGWGDIKETERYIDIEKRYRKRYNKLIEDASEVEMRHLLSLEDAFCKEFLFTKDELREIMGEFGGTTEDLYLYLDVLQAGDRGPETRNQLEYLNKKYGLRSTFR
jgi:hypothetical protein